jgi:LPXTG-motif cell wall-anchored protein
MAQALDRDTRIIVIIGILVAQVVLIGALLFYFRKKENDTLNTLFQLQERLDQVEIQLHRRHQTKSDVSPAP